MTKVSELLSKPIISIFDAKIIGTISNIYFDQKMSKGTVLAIYNDEPGEAEEKFVAIKDIVNIDNEAAVIKSSENVTYNWNTALGAVNPINCPAYTQDGKLLGIVKDVLMEDFRVKSILVGKQELDAAQLLTHSGKMLVFNDTGKPIKKPGKKKIPNSVTQQSVQIHKPAPPLPVSGSGGVSVTSLSSPGSESATAIVFPTPDEAPLQKVPAPGSDKEIAETFPEYIASTVGIPSRPTSTLVSRSPMSQETDESRFDFLIGKTVQKSIYSSQGQIIAQANSVISAEIVSRAKREGKMVQLALHSTDVQIL